MTGNDATEGMRLARNRQFAEALPLLERAQSAAPTDIALLHATASLLLWASRGSDAIARYRDAAARAGEDPGILAGWARAALLAGDQREALHVIERLLERDPQSAASGGPLDAMLRETRDVGLGCALLGALATRRPADAGLHLLLGQTLLAAERLDEAQAGFERAATLRPHDPVPLVELGSMAMSRGDRDGARALYRRALAADPQSARALWGLAHAGEGLLDPQLLGRVRERLAAETDPRALAALHDVLVRHHDVAGEPAAAAQHAQASNTLLLRQVPPQHRYDQAAHARDIDATVRDVDAPLLDRLRDAGNPDPRPVFVIGLPRSGTTLLERMLASHPGVAGIGEQGFASTALRRALAASGGGPRELAPQAIHDAAAWHLAALGQRVARLGQSVHARRIVDKMPDNYLIAGWLRIAFPQATIIHCVRDPRDVALSCWLTQFAAVPWSHDLGDIAHRIEQHRRLMRHWRVVLGAGLVEIRYEDLVADPEPSLRRAFEAMRVKWHPGALAFSDRAGFVGSASRNQVREGLHARRVARWRGYVEALAPVLPRLEAVAAQDASERGNATPIR